MEKRGLGLVCGLIVFFTAVLVSTVVWAEGAPLPEPKVSDIFGVEIDYHLSFEKMIEAGNYQWKSREITAKNLPISGKGKVSLQLVVVHFNRHASNKEVLDFFAAHNLEPAKIEHLLAFGALYPAEQYSYPILALGSDWMDGVGRRQVPALGSIALTTGIRRTLWLRCADREWSLNYRFLAIKK